MKNRFLFLSLLFLPLFSFGAWDAGDGVLVDSVYFFRYDGFDSPSSYRTSPHHAPNSFEDVKALYFSNVYGIKYRFLPNSSAISFIAPTASKNNFFLAQGSSGVNVSNSFVCTTNGVSRIPTTAFYFSQVRPFYLFPVYLYNAGYRGPGIEAFQSGNDYCLNVDLSKLIPDVLSSTNTVYSQILFSQLSAINSGVVNISSDLSGISYAIAGLGPFTYDQASNFVYALSVESSGNSIFPGFRINAQEVLDSLDPSKNDQSTPEFREYFDFQRQATVRGLTLAAELAGLSNMLVDDDTSSTLSNLGNSFNKGVNNNLENLSGHVSGLADDVHRLSTNDWASVVTNRLANNTASITNQLAHMFDSNDPGTVGKNVADISGAAGTLASTVSGGAVSVRLSGQEVFGVHLDAPVSIEENQMSTVTIPLGSIKDNLSHWYSDWTDFYFSSSPEKGWLKYFDLFSEFKDVNHSDLVSIQSCVSNLLVSFSSYTNGLPFVISNAIAGLSLSSTNSYLLLSDYADYIHSGGLDALLDLMDDDSYSDLKAEIDSLYHADTAEGYGRWWRYFTGLSTVQANSIFKLSNIFQAHEKLLKDLKRDNSDLEVQDASDPSVFRKLLYTIPSEEDTFNKLSQLTNSIDQSGMVSVQRLIPDLTNRFNVAASLYDKDFALPAEISWELIPADPSINSPARVVTIRPSEHYRLFQLLHFGLAFSYCLVNIILFPKFLLLLVRLFDRVWNKSEKLIYNSTQS